MASGVATATLLTEGVVPPSGIVTVLAFTHGEESFHDNNGDGIFNGGDTIETDDIPEPFIDFRPLPPLDSGCSISAPSPLCNNRFDPSVSFERFIDTNGNGVWDSFPVTGLAQGTHGVWDSNILVWDSVPVTFSGPLVTPQVTSPLGSFNIPNGGAQAFTIEVHDDLLNPLAGGSTITVTASAGTISGGAITIPDGESFNRLVDGLTRFSFVLSDTDSTMNTPTASSITVTITSPNGSGAFVVASGVVN